MFELPVLSLKLFPRKFCLKFSLFARPAFLSAAAGGREDAVGVCDEADELRLCLLGVLAAAEPSRRSRVLAYLQLLPRLCTCSQLKVY